MARWQQCLRRFSPQDIWGGTGSSGADARSSHELACTADASSERPRFRVTVDSFHPGHPTVFRLTVHHGDAVWRIRRRYQQVWAVHTSLVNGLGRSSLPQPPPRNTWRSAMFGQQDRLFLHDRQVRLQIYFDELLQAVPLVEHCEALYKFLCYTTLRNWEYGTMAGMDMADPEEDVRELPCGHLFHYRCISQWLKERNTCCVCNGAAILSAPRLTWPND